MSGATKFHTFVYSQDGVNFIQKFGARVTEKATIMSLDFSNIDWDLVSRWKTSVMKSDLNPSFELIKSISREQFKQVLDLACAASDEIDEMDNNGFVNSKESAARDWFDLLDYWKKIAMSHDTIITRNLSGDVVGFTMCLFPCDEPEKAGQSITTVWKHLRGNGYGKLLKALMLENIRDNHPHIKLIETETNDLNESIVGINRKLGFIEKITHSSYSVDYSKAIEVLKRL